MALDLTALEAEVARNTDVDASASLLLKMLFDEVEANKTNPAAIQAIVDRVRQSSDALSAAVVAHTPGASDTEVPPAPPTPPEPPAEASPRKR